MLRVYYTLTCVSQLRCNIHSSWFSSHDIQYSVTDDFYIAVDTNKVALFSSLVAHTGLYYS